MITLVTNKKNDVEQTMISLDPATSIKNSVCTFKQQQPKFGMKMIEIVPRNVLLFRSKDVD